MQRPFVLETVSLDLFLMREAADISRKLGTKTDFVALLDEFAPRFYGEVSGWVLALSQRSWY